MKVCADRRRAIRLDHLTEAQAKAFMIADNRLTEISVWDARGLAEQLKEALGLGPRLQSRGQRFRNGRNRFQDRRTHSRLRRRPRPRRCAAGRQDRSSDKPVRRSWFARRE